MTPIPGPRNRSGDNDDDEGDGYGGRRLNDWSQPELVRAVKALSDAMTKALDELRVEIRGMRVEFMPRELAELKHKQVAERLDEHGREIVDIQAELERAVHQRERDANMRWDKWIPPIVTGVIVATVMYLVTTVLSTH